MDEEEEKGDFREKCSVAILGLFLRCLGLVIELVVYRLGERDN